MSGILRKKGRRNIDDVTPEDEEVSVSESLDVSHHASDIEIYAREVLSTIIADNVPATPNNYSLYFDRLLEDKSESLRREIRSILELEESNDTEATVALEQNLKHGFSSIKELLGVTANLYKNMALMNKILEKRKEELAGNPAEDEVMQIIAVLESDVSKLNSIIKSQSSKMKHIYDHTATIVKNVENETIFDNQFGVHNKRYLVQKIEKEIGLINEFHHKSSLMMIELDQDLKKSIKNEKAVLLLTRTIARLLLKTSRRSDVIAHYGNGIFSMLLKHTDIENAKRAAIRLSELVANSNFFLGDTEIQLKISMGITSVDSKATVEEIIVRALDGIEKAYGDKKNDFAVVLG